MVGLIEDKLLCDLGSEYVWEVMAFEVASIRSYYGYAIELIILLLVVEVHTIFFQFFVVYLVGGTMLIIKAPIVIDL